MGPWPGVGTRGVVCRVRFVRNCARLSVNSRLPPATPCRSCGAKYPTMAKDCCPAAPAQPGAMWRLALSCAGRGAPAAAAGRRPRALTAIHALVRAACDDLPAGHGVRHRVKRLGGAAREARRRVRALVGGAGEAAQQPKALVRPGSCTHAGRAPLDAAHGQALYWLGLGSHRVPCDLTARQTWWRATSDVRRSTATARAGWQVAAEHCRVSVPLLDVDSACISLIVSV